MSWLFESDRLKTKEDFQIQLEEIHAYRMLDGCDFDFGNGLIQNEMLQGSEDAYYEMDLQTIEEILIYWEEDCLKRKKRRNRVSKNHQREYIEKEKNRLQHLSVIKWNLVYEHNGRLRRIYRGKRSSYLKKRSNRKVRRFKGDVSAKGNGHHKIFDFWWELD